MRHLLDTKIIRSTIRALHAHRVQKGDEGGEEHARALTNKLILLEKTSISRPVIAWLKWRKRA